MKVPLFIRSYVKFWKGIKSKFSFSFKHIHKYLKVEIYQQFINSPSFYVLLQMLNFIFMYLFYKLC